MDTLKAVMSSSDSSDDNDDDLSSNDGADVETGAQLFPALPVCFSWNNVTYQTQLCNSQELLSPV